MQATARELNLSETVFLLPADGEADAQMRIFTPTTELPFAGHPVLGAAVIVAVRERRDVVRLRTSAGIVPVNVAPTERDDVFYGEMEQPIPAIELFDQADALRAALGVEAATLPIEVYDNGPRHVMVTLSDEASVTGLEPDMAALAALGDYGFSCFARAATGGAAVRTRMFGPALGVAEDPATGSAAGPLAVHLARHRRIHFGETIEIHQGREIGRPSLLHARADGTAERIERVVVGGCAVRVAHGRFRLQ